MVNHTSDELVEEPITLTFSVDEVIAGRPLGPNSISSAMLEEFIVQVNKFLKGSKRTDIKQVNATIGDGSFAYTASAQSAILAEAAADWDKANSSSDISDLDPARRRVITEWQNLARLNPGRVYTLSLNGKDLKSFVINAESEYHSAMNVWVEVEQYVYGEIYDAGGMARANVHVKLENGRSLTVGSDKDLLASDKENRLYQKQLLRIKAMYNVKTGQLKDEELLGYEYYNPHYDEAQLAGIQEKAAAIWEGAPPTAWVEAMRGTDG